MILSKNVEKYTVGEQKIQFTNLWIINEPLQLMHYSKAWLILNQKKFQSALKREELEEEASLTLHHRLA